MNQRRTRNPHDDAGGDEKLGGDFQRHQLCQERYQNFASEVWDEAPFDTVELRDRLSLRAGRNEVVTSEGEPGNPASQERSRTRAGIL